MPCIGDTARRLSIEAGGLEEAAELRIEEAIRDSWEAGFGRAPAGVDLVGESWFLVAFLHEVFDAEDRSLVAEGRFPEVRIRRRKIRDGLAPSLCEVVAATVGRPVQCTVGEVEEDDVVVLTFLFDVDER
jgi:hypothetical protein